ncbi:DUF4173 domain-containing protein [Paenibacillus oenotherae]|uniref:DUF4173 domain-containing protein n=1 Tax=Paenibacillus oenotherae TaxID=1435645 RepID=A0ABS7DBZ8_9BACL|nr:DUF4173 domain-containing protein [Paenibacillus oenotherae]MBW7477294.1 DUF4173 domain-containing protein [Paenibacillus oenotherae]
MGPTLQHASKRPLAALIAAFALAVLHQYLFYGNLLGVSYPIFVICFYLYMLLFAKDRIQQHPPGYGWMLFGSIMMLSMTYVWFDNPVFYGLNLVVIPALICLHLTLMLSFRKLSWDHIRLFTDVMDYAIPQLFRHWPAATKVARHSVSRKLGSRQKEVMSKVLIGLSIAVPLLFVILLLLSSADGMFHLALTRFPYWVGGLSLGEGLVRLAWVIIAGNVMFAYLRGFLHPKKYEWEENGEAEESPDRRQLDPIIIATVLIAINIVYVMFVIIQFSYLFGAWDGGLPADKSYAEYARSGFIELVAVSVINFSIILCTMAFGGRGGGTLITMNRYMLYLLIACSAVMLYSAYMRLDLYEAKYGYTYIRFLVHAFMIYLGLLLITACLCIAIKRISLAKCYIVISLLAYLAVNYIGMDVIIAQNNIDRFRTTGQIDASYLSRLSSDAIPLLASFGQEEYPDMKYYLKRNWGRLSRTDHDWPSFNRARYRAEQALEAYYSK